MDSPWRLGMRPGLRLPFYHARPVYVISLSSGQSRTLPRSRRRLTLKFSPVRPGLGLRSGLVGLESDLWLALDGNRPRFYIYCRKSRVRQDFRPDPPPPDFDVNCQSAYFLAFELDCCLFIARSSKRLAARSLYRFATSPCAFDVVCCRSGNKSDDGQRSLD